MSPPPDKRDDIAAILALSNTVERYFPVFLKDAGFRVGKNCRFSIRHMYTGKKMIVIEN